VAKAVRKIINKLTKNGKIKARTKRE